MGDIGSTRPSRRVACRVVAVVVGAMLAAATAAIPRPVLAFQDSTQAIVPGSAAAQAAGAAAPGGVAAGRRPATAVPSLLDADADQDGVPDYMDECPATPPGTPVARHGCAAGEGFSVAQLVGLAAALGTLLGLAVMRIFRRALRVSDPEVPPLLFGRGARHEEAPTDPRPTPAAPHGGAGWADAAAARWVDEAGSGPAVPPAAPVAAAAHAPVSDGGLGASGSGAARPSADVSRARSLEAARGSVASAADALGAGARPEMADESQTELVDARTVRFFRPVSATMQLLPGRLEIVAGAEPGHVIRFVRIPGVPPEITFGRSRGTPPLHVQLLLPTVSRRHARMRYADGGWRITNHSRTNPVVVNGEVLAGDGESRALVDGDRIEMGEVAFVFRER